MAEKFLSPHPDTFCRRLDPRTKLALLATAFILAILPQHPAVISVAVLLVLIHLTLARAWPWLWRLRWLLFLLAVFSITVWSLLAKGITPLLWRLTWESLAFGVATFLKLATMLIAGLILLATTPIEELFLGLVKLRLPYPVAFAFALALRWVPEILATAQRVADAQQARGLPPPTGHFLSRLKDYLPLLVPIFLLTLRRSQTVAWALEARGFMMHPHRTYFLETHLTSRDWAALTLAALLLAAFLTLHLLGLDRLPGLSL